jgi:sporadic carbohydrate cluster protein (TIGR04323 family)
MKKKFRGYISSRECLGTFFPQRVQNIVIRDFCNINNLDYLLSSAEYSMNNSYFVFKEIIKSIKNIDGIVAFSIFQLPEDLKNRIKLLNLVINKKKHIFFALERISVKKKIDFKRVNEIWMIRKSIKENKRPWTSNIEQ